ncbi:MAG: WxcM-like domain-containing protein [Verrucomicrobiaceae bacterium]|nr:WxcM-like domain-containing protein [Verrucomicrobiaceae bacterium]
MSRSFAIVKPTSVRGVMRYNLRYIHDARGNLAVGEFGRDLPFQPKRFFMTFEIPDSTTRGEHAHRQCHQFLVCVRGFCRVLVDDGENRAEFVLNRPTLGIYVPPMVWAAEYGHSHDSTLLVFASDYYDQDDYIRDYGEFSRLVGQSGVLGPV